MNVIAWLEFELVYSNVTAQRVSHYATGTSPKSCMKTATEQWKFPGPQNSKDFHPTEKFSDVLEQQIRSVEKSYKQLAAVKGLAYFIDSFV